MDIDLRREWYNRADVLSNLVPLLREREICFLMPKGVGGDTKRYPVRCIKAHHHTYLLRNMEAFSFFIREYNLYHSVYLLQDMPMFSFHPLKRTEQQHDFFNKYYDYVKGIDFVIDIDGDQNLELEQRIDNARLQTITICDYMDKFNIPYNIVFSGNKGFHIEVRGFPATQKWSDCAKEFEEIAINLVLVANSERDKKTELSDSELREYLKVRFSFDSSIYTTTRIWKCPYSYDVKTDCIVMPLNREELINFNINDYKIQNAMKKKYWGIGLKTRKGDINNFILMKKELLER